MKKLPETNSDRRATQRALSALAGIACATRLIYASAVYLQNTGNAAWMEAIGGTVIAMPAMLMLLHLIKIRAGQAPEMNKLKKCICMLYIPFFSFDAASWVFSLAEGSSYTTFAEANFFSLFLPALLVATLIASRGANACGGLARGVLPAILFCVGLTILWQAEDMQPIWLTPILGGGIRSLARGSVLCGGYASLYPAGVWLFLESGHTPVQDDVRRRYVWAFPAAGLAAMAFLLMYGMLSPNIPYAPHIRSFALERLLTGGGRNTSVHFPSLLSWYTMLLTAAIFSMFCTVKCLKLLFPSRSSLFCAAISALLCLLWIPVRMFWKKAEDLLVFANVIVVTLSFVLLLLQAYLEKRRFKHAST